MKKRVIWILIIFVLVVIFLVYFLLKNEKISEGYESSDKTQIANPASTYCIEHGGNLSIRDSEDGSQYGVCVFSNGVECEEWQFFRGECNLTLVENECKEDSDCVPASCCHPTSCVNKNFAPICSGTMCTMDCKIGTLDCGYGSCVCINKKCSAVIQQ
jgi:putative hemolysin